MTPSRTKPRTKKQVKRRLHKGRLALLLSPFVFIIIIIAIIIWRPDTDDILLHSADEHLPITEAVRAGRRDAEKVLRTSSNSYQREKSLLEIKARESLLREKGYNQAADDYITAAKNLLIKKGVISDE